MAKEFFRRAFAARVSDPETGTAATRVARLRPVVRPLLMLFVFYWVLAGFFAFAITGSLGGSAYSPADEAPAIARLGMSSIPAREQVVVDVEGVAIHGSFYENPDDAECAVVMAHGRDASRAGMTVYLPMFWRYGCDVVLYDLRGTGDSEGGPRTYGVDDRLDVVVLVEWVAERAGLAHDQIGLLGTSYGAATTIQATPLLPDLAFVVADSPFADLESIVRDQAYDMYSPVVRPLVWGSLLLAGWRAGIDIDEASTVEAISESDVPVLIIHSADDTFITPDHAQRIYDAAEPSRTDLHIVEWGAPHAVAFQERPVEYREIVDAFLRSNVHSWPEREDLSP